MKRDPGRLTDGSFDVAVVGGGILGAFISLLASRAGLRVTLLEKEDFASGTTSGSGKVLHGGIRYLQSLRLSLAAEAQREQKKIADAAPDLVRPLPFLVPVRDGRARERLLVRAGAWAWRGFSTLAPGGADLPTTRYTGGAEFRNLIGSLDETFRGGMLFHDVQLRSPERLTFEIVRRAAEEGAVVANYAEVAGIRVASDRIAGVDVRDVLNESEHEVDTSVVVNAAGPWAPEVGRFSGDQFPDVALGKGLHVVLDRPEPQVALALPYRGQGTEYGERRVFVMPWEGRTLVGASYAPFDGCPDQASATGEEISDFIGTLHSHWPGLELEADQVAYAYSGLYPVFDQREIPKDRYAASLHPLIVDHGDRGGPAGLYSAMSVKLTTARALAEEILNRIARDGQLDGGRPASGRKAHNLPDLTPNITPARLADPEHLPDLARRAARDEMAAHLSDVLFRRSWIGHLGHPGRARVEEAASTMARVHDWPDDETNRQVRQIDEIYEALGTRVPVGNRERSQRDREAD